MSATAKPPTHPEVERQRVRLLMGIRDYDIPDHMVDGITEHVLRGRETGGFLTKLLEGDIHGAAASADTLNLLAMDRWSSFLLTVCPPACHGSPAMVKAWREMGGVQGTTDKTPTQGVPAVADANTGHPFEKIPGFSEVHPRHGGHHWVFKFPNTYGASVIRHAFSYGGASGLYEIAVLDAGGEISYTTPITDDVLGYLNEANAIETLGKIAALPSTSAVVEAIKAPIADVAPSASRPSPSAIIADASALLKQLDNAIDKMVTALAWMAGHPGEDQTASEIAAVLVDLRKARVSAAKVHAESLKAIR